MGMQIGFLCAAQGFEVTIYDAVEAALENAPERLAKAAKSLVRHRRVTPEMPTLELYASGLPAMPCLQERMQT